MHNKLSELYDQQLTALRTQGANFAEHHPKIASRLKLGQGTAEDPLVGRLLESTAFLTAKLQYQLQADEQELDQNLLSLLYPHYFLPLPAASTIKLFPQADLDEEYLIDKNTTLSTVVSDNSQCHFTTVYPVAVKPVSISNVHYQQEGRVPAKQHAPKALKSCLSFTFASLQNQALKTLDLTSLRLFINAELPIANAIRELLLSHCKEVIVSNGKADINIKPENIQAVGFAEHEAMLPFPINSFSGYRLLFEYFAYPEKFQYIDINGLDEVLFDEISDITIHFYFDQYQANLTNKITNDTLDVNCTPIVNLFEQVAEPITFDQQHSQYEIVADNQLKKPEIEVYSVESVAISSVKYKNTVDCMPYFSKHISHKGSGYLFWHAKRTPYWALGEQQLAGDQVDLVISDFAIDDLEEQLILTPQLLCTNRDLVNFIPFGGGKPNWTFSKQNHETIRDIRCLTNISEPQYHEYTNQRRQLAQHLYLNQIGVGSDKETLQNLQLLLTSYQFNQTQSMIQGGLIAATCEPVTIRHPATIQQGFCRGLHYQLTVDEQYFIDNDIYLFGSVLHEFLTKSCSINAFVILDIHSKQRGALFSWKPKLGTKPIM